MLQLCCCIEAHLKENTAYFQVRPGLPPCLAHCRAPLPGCRCALGPCTVSLTLVSAVPRLWPGPLAYTGAAGAGQSRGSDPLLLPQFFSDVREAEEQLRKLQETLHRKYTCDRSITVTRLEDLLQDAQVSRSAGSALCSGWGQTRRPGGAAAGARGQLQLRAVQGWGRHGGRQACCLG